ncbi:hypothetical protein [Curtobacterium sp. ZW137]|uniref:hypothetical protein n=1 Tax=Curtobacterium sp. ZW137 TaxID=2485104 RepID=UPI000F4BE07C|nr:hypothetical protein [Curtobacterium sp. ZW137]ROP65654.1 hypothetical protein EDF55_0092 [Curtobacterium sp. ZW137]
MTDEQTSKFQMLAAHIDDQHDRWGMDGVMSGPEPLYWILGILHEASQQPSIDGARLIEEIFEQMSLNFSVGFDFNSFYKRMESERASLSTYKPSVEDPTDQRDTEQRIAAISNAHDASPPPTLDIPN